MSVKWELTFNKNKKKCCKKTKKAPASFLARAFDLRSLRKIY